MQKSTVDFVGVAFYRWGLKGTLLAHVDLTENPPGRLTSIHVEEMDSFFGISGESLERFQGNPVGYRFGMAPSLDSSDHQEYYMFSRDSELKLHFPLLQGGGHIQVIVYFFSIVFCTFLILEYLGDLRLSCSIIG